MDASLEVDVNASFARYCSINIAVHPLGNISSAKFSEFFQILHKFTCIANAEIQHATFSQKVQSLIPSHPGARGNTYFHFLPTQTEPSKEWKDFQLHRSILAVIFVCYITDDTPLTSYLTLISQAKQHYKRSVSTSLILLHPPSHDPQIKQDSSIDFIVPIPDSSHLNSSFVLDNFLNIAQDITAKLDDKLLNIKSFIPQPKTPLDDTSILPASEQPAQLDGRLKKLEGDLCLLLGSPQDAFRRYTDARADTLLSHDSLWTLGCDEGMIACYFHPDVLAERIRLSTPCKLSVLFSYVQHLADCYRCVIDAVPSVHLLSFSSFFDGTAHALVLPQPVASAAAPSYGGGMGAGVLTVSPAVLSFLPKSLASVPDGPNYRVAPFFEKPATTGNPLPPNASLRSVQKQLLCVSIELLLSSLSASLLLSPHTRVLLTASLSSILRRSALLTRCLGEYRPQVPVFLRLAQLSRFLGLKRKSAFFALSAASLLKYNNSLLLSHKMLLSLAPMFQLGALVGFKEPGVY